jgi:hypothetical protein
MNTYRNNARIAGILFLAAIVTGVLSVPSLGLLEESDYLIQAAAHETQLIIGVLLTAAMAFACAGIAIWLYPALKTHNPALALTAVGFRLMEAALFVVGAAVLLPLLPLSQAYVAAGAPDGSHFQTLGDFILAFHHSLAAETGAIAFCLGALMYYTIFYQSELIPRWLSGWGFIATAMHLVAVFLVIFGSDPFSTPTLLLNLPILLNELMLAVWLIAKGFKPSGRWENGR